MGNNAAGGGLQGANGAQEEAVRCGGFDNGGRYNWSWNVREGVEEGKEVINGGGAGVCIMHAPFMSAWRIRPF